MRLKAERNFYLPFLDPTYCIDRIDRENGRASLQRKEIGTRTPYPMGTQ